MASSSTKVLTPREVGLEILESLNAHFNINLRPIIDDVSLPFHEKKSLLVHKLVEAAIGDIDLHHHLHGLVYSDTASDKKVCSALVQNKPRLLLTELVASGVEVEANISYPFANAERIGEYTGPELYDFVYRTSKRFEAMAKASTASVLAIEIGKAGATAIGAHMFAAARAVYAPPTVGWLSALRTGITSFGLKASIAIIVIVLVAILLYLLLDNPKKILGFVVNNTDDDLVVKDWRRGCDGGSGGDLWMEHGEMTNFPEDYQDGDFTKPYVQVAKRVIFAKDDPTNSVSAGVFFGDRNVGFRGSEGVMIFSSSTSPTLIALQFAVPYINDNGTDIEIIDGRPSSMTALYRKIYDSRKTRVETSKGDYRLTSTVNDPSGGTVALAATIYKPVP